VNKALTTLVALMTGILLASPALCAVTDVMETWDFGTANWLRYDPLNQCYLGLANNSGHLSVTFGAQGSMPVPEVSIIRAETNSSGGAFTGNYLAAGVTNVSFKFMSASALPAKLGVYFHCGASGDWWYYPLTPGEPGVWTQHNVPMDCWKGWRRDDGVSAEVFRSDMSSNDWIGVLIQRNGSMAAQEYGIDDFVLRGVNLTVDSDGDGMSDWAEFLAGTDPLDPHDRLWVEIGRSNGLIVVKWRSADKRVYGVWRSTDLSLRPWPEKVATGVQATPPTNTYVEEGAAGVFPVFYRIQMEQ
jgi:hypothetical protein